MRCRVNPLLLHDILRTTAQRIPDRPGLSLQGRVRTFGELQARADHLAAVLAARGVRRGARVTGWADMSLEAPPLYSAVASLGAVFVPLNPAFGRDEADAMCDLVEPDLRVTDERHDGDVVIDALYAQRAPGGVETADVAETDPDVIFCTSGTTGTPKGVVLSHRSNRLRAVGHDGRPGATLTMMPLFHWGGWAFLHDAWHGGDEMVLQEATDATTLLRAIDARRVARFYAIPAVWRRILAEDLSRYDLSSLREANSGTSTTGLELLHAIHAALPGTTSWVGYGATEVGGIARLSFDDFDRKPGSVGLPVPGVETRFVDGELWVRSPQMALGYWKNPDADAATFVDGWYRTGDLVERDDDGYLYVVGRVKDLIRTGGEFVAPPEVDRVIQQHPAVADGAVAGVPDEDWGEVVAAFVTLRPGARLDLDGLRAHCRGRLADFKHPRRLYLVEAIPRTGPTGQVQRRHLVDVVSAR